MRPQILVRAPTWVEVPSGRNHAAPQGARPEVGLPVPGPVEAPAAPAETGVGQVAAPLVALVRPAVALPANSRAVPEVRPVPTAKEAHLLGVPVPKDIRRVPAVSHVKVTRLACDLLEPPFHRVVEVTSTEPTSSDPSDRPLLGP